MENFFPDADYTIPSTSNYMKFSEGENTFRILSSAIIGYEYFNKDNKPVRSKAEFDGIPEDIKMVKNDKGESVPGRVNHFWAFLVYNYQDRRVQVLELTQKGIMKTMQGYIKNPKWGNPQEYDFVVNREGTGFDTEYSVAVNPKSDMPEVKIPPFNLEALYHGNDPFDQSKQYHPIAGAIDVPVGEAFN